MRYPKLHPPCSYVLAMMTDERVLAHPPNGVFFSSPYGLGGTKKESRGPEGPRPAPRPLAVVTGPGPPTECRTKRQRARKASPLPPSTQWAATFGLGRAG